MQVTAYLGLGSRYSYLAATQLQALEAQTGATLDWVPVDSVSLIRRSRRGGSPFDTPQTEGQYDGRYRDLDAARWAKLYGVPYRSPVLTHLDSGTMALACWSMPHAASRRACMERLFQAVFVDGPALTPDLVNALADSVSAHRLGPEEAAAAHEAALDQALAAGVFGVPSFVVDDALFWGNDRLPLVKQHLMELRRG